MGELVNLKEYRAWKAKQEEEKELAEMDDTIRRIDLFALGEAMADRGWHLDRQGPPPSLHMTVSAGNAKAVDEFLADLSQATEHVRGGPTGEVTQYATLE